MNYPMIKVHSGKRNMVLRTTATIAFAKLVSFMALLNSKNMPIDINYLYCQIWTKVFSYSKAEALMGNVIETFNIKHH